MVAVLDTHLGPQCGASSGMHMYNIWERHEQQEALFVSSEKSYKI